jgi:hypothetical protein
MLGSIRAFLRKRRCKLSRSRTPFGFGRITGGTPTPRCCDNSHPERSEGSFPYILALRIGLGPITALYSAFGHLSPVGTGERAINMVDISCEADLDFMLAFPCEAASGVAAYVERFGFFYEFDPEGKLAELLNSSGDVNGAGQTMVP